MLHMVGLVFQGGLGIPLYVNEELFGDQPPELVWALASAIQTFVIDTLGKAHGRRTSTDLKSGNVRLVMYDPFADLDVVPDVDLYSIMALQDRHDNLEITNDKLREIHNKLLPLGLDKSGASIGFSVPEDIREKIRAITLRTQHIPEDQVDSVKNIIELYKVKLEEGGCHPLVFSLADIDGGLLFSIKSRELYEDPAFSELLLSNIVAENPSDAKTVWIEREAPMWVGDLLVEAFVMYHIGKNSDFRLLARVCFPRPKQDYVRGVLKELTDRLYERLEYIIGL